MKCALHVHTNLSDGALTPAEAIQIYADLGFGCVAITDHEFLLREHYWQEIKRAKRDDIIVLVGVELDYEPWHYHHLLRIQGEVETLHVLAHPASYYLETQEVTARIQNAFFPIDAIEVTHRGFYTPLYDTKALPWPKIASDDAHEPSEFGRAWIEVPETKRPDQVLRAIKAGDLALGFYRAHSYQRPRR